MAAEAASQRRAAPSPPPTPEPGRGRVRLRLLLALLLLGPLCVLVTAQGPGGVIAQAPLWSYWLLFFALLIGSGTISSAETAIFSLDKLDLNQMRNQPSWNNRRILHLLERSNETLVTMMIFNNIVNIGIALTASAITVRLAGGRGGWYVIPLATAIAGGGIMLFGEIMPKMLAHANAQRFARVLAPFLWVIDIVFSPLRFILNFVLRVIFRLLGIHERPGAAEVSEEELKVMINSGEVSQVLEQDEREMIDGVFELRRTTVSEILTPRMAVVSVPEELDQDAMLARLRELSVSRVLVTRDSMDDLAGFLLVKEVLLNPTQPWREHLREPMMVPEGVGLLDVLGSFRRQRTKMAVVVDEYGGIAGIITLQDVLEEIVGDMYERHEVASKDLAPLAPGVWRAAGSILLEELTEELHVPFPEQKGRTLGGFIMNTLGRVPQMGDEVVHETLLLRIESMVARRVNSVVIEEITGMGEGSAAATGGEDAS